MPYQCPECGASVEAGAEVCEHCGATVSRPETSSNPLKHAWSSTATTVLETLLVVAILGSLIGAIWMMRPGSQGQSAAGPGPRPTPTPLPTSTATFTRTPTSTPTSTPTVTPTATPSFFTHRVKSGDTLIAIALEYETTVTAILQANDMDENHFLQIGQELIIPLDADFEFPTVTVTPLPGSEFNVITHTVRAGDTLLGIAGEYNTTVSDLIEANDLSSEDVLLHIDQVLIIPSEDPTPTPDTPTLTPTTTPSPTPRYSPTPAEPTATPRFTIPAPVLLSPPDGVLIEDEAVLLNWLSVGVLSDETWYLVRLQTARTGEPETAHEVWVKANAWRIPDDLAPEPGTTQRYRWDVTVIRKTGENEQKALSPRSEIRTFRWEMRDR